MKRLYLIAFQGTGSRPEYLAEEGLIHLGHVGIQLEGENAIFGFRPTDTSMQAVGDTAQVLEHLKQGNLMPGGVYDDKNIFERASEISTVLKRTAVWEYVYEITDQEFERIRSLLADLMKECTLEYALPQRDEAKKEIFRENVYNCATFPEYLGLLLPVQTGYLESYVRAMTEKGKRWVENQP